MSKNKKREKLVHLLILLFLVISLLAKGTEAVGEPVISNILINPSLDVGRFAPYNITADISNLAQGDSATVNVEGINGDGYQYWNYFADGRGMPDNINKTMDYDTESGKWKSQNIYPDNIYPEIFFSPSSVTWDNAPSDTILRRANYQIMHFSNPYSITANTNFWIEFNAYRRSEVNSADLSVYLVEKNHDITYFQNDWRNKAGVELVGSIYKDTPFSHVHSINSSHHLVALTSNLNSSFGNKNLDISGDFWLVFYSDSPNNARGWDFRYQPQTRCDINNRWYSGNQGNWATTVQAGCPDAHIHLARKSTQPGGIKDGAKITVTATNNNGTNSSWGEFFYNELPNLAPNASTFLSPSVGDTINGQVNISWDAATDPNDDNLVYDIFLTDSGGNQIGEPLALGTQALNLVTTLDEGSYSLKGRVRESDTNPSLYRDFDLGGVFYVNNTEPIRSITALNISSNNNQSSELGQTGDIITLSFVTSGIPEGNPVVSVFSGGEATTNSVSLFTEDNTHWAASYEVSANDSDGDITFIISSPYLDADYMDLIGDDSGVVVDNLTPEVSVISPQGGENLTGLVELQAGASDLGTGIEKVEFYINGFIFGTDYTTPYTATWDTNALTPGNYIITAKAYDNIGHSTISQAVGVSIPDNPPEFLNLPDLNSVINVTPGQIISANSYLLQVRPSDDVGITKTEFYLNNYLICTDLSADDNSIYDCNWNVSEYDPGDYQIIAKAYDTDGNTRDTEPVTVIKPDNAPTYGTLPGRDSLINLVEDQLITADSYLIQVMPLDDVRISYVEFYAENELLCTDTMADSEGIFDCSWILANFNPGQYAIKTKAYDGSGQSTWLGPIIVTIADRPPVFINLPGLSVTININEGQTITTNPYLINVKPTDNVSIQRVEFLVDGTLICTDTTADIDGVYSCSWDTSRYHSSITVYAYDGAGNRSLALTRNATVDPALYMSVLPATGKRN